MATNVSETFVIDNKQYLAFPNLEEFLIDAGIPSHSKRERILKALDSMGIDDITQLYSMSRYNLELVNGLNEKLAKQIYLHVQRIKRRGNLVITAEELEKVEQSYLYLPSGSSDVDKMLTYANGKTGFRSKTLIELYGEPSMGKTQFCMTAAALVMRPVVMGGWGQAVAYIDSEGSFEFSRFSNLARYWGISSEYLMNNLYVSKVDSFDDVEEMI